ncbi:MAG: ectoine synthase [Pseudomonadales bacterium]
MIIRKLQETVDTPRHIRSDNWDSARMLLESDGMGFSFHITTLYAGTENPMWYKHHLESVYCISGKAELHDLAAGTRHTIEPGTLYALNDNDRHVLKILEDFTCACVFNPALRGTEVHDADGAYRLDAAPVS